ncbi:MAG: leucine-rich repeat domain-containing protein [Defluviitaleaceae bacterium]|nr:leucine-rich repeat domain-containing protein [Defluviitaleaceae bacterium]
MALDAKSDAAQLHLHAEVNEVDVNVIGSTLFRLQCITVDKDNQHFTAKDGILYNKDETILLCFPREKGSDIFSIPDCITQIGENALRDCERLTGINLPSGLQRIGSNAFWCCKGLKRIHIPAGVKEIGEMALLGCTALEEITVNEANPNYCAVGDVLYNKAQTQLIVAAAAAKREFFCVPNTVRSFGVAAFRECVHLKHITIPEGVKELSRGLFDDCWHLEEIELPFSLERIAPIAFSYCHGLKKIIIPFFVHSIGWNAFHWCEGLEEIYLPQHLKELGADDLTQNPKLQSAIGMCDSLKRINIPPELTELGASELSMCHTLEDVIIPPTITKIGERAFSACPALTLTVYEGTAGHIYTVENKIPFRLASKIIAAHAGTGKTTLAANHPENFIDLVVMPYKYLLPDTPQEEHEANKANPELEIHPEWPSNYIKAIKEAMKSGRTLLIPPSYPVLCELYRGGIPYTLAYPNRTLKEEYRARYAARGNNETFMRYFVDGWDEFQDDFKEDNYGTHLVLEAGEYLSDRVLP